VPVQHERLLQLQAEILELLEEQRLLLGYLQVQEVPVGSPGRPSSSGVPRATGAPDVWIVDEGDILSTELGGSLLFSGAQVVLAGAF
jgi:hypothetical protein